jgi:hypothetical protein
VRSLLPLVTALLVACGSAPEPAPERVTGLIQEVKRGGSGKITAFTVRGYEIRIEPRRDYGFDLEHLVEHQVQRLPVRVTLDERDDGLYAVEILDA